MTASEPTEDAAPDGSRLGAVRAWPLERLLILVALGLVLVAPAVVGGGDPAFYIMMPIPVVLLIAVTFTAVLLRWGAPWTFLAAGVAVSLLPVAILAQFGLTQLSNPLLSREFPANVLLATALLLALPAGVAGFLRARADQPHPRVAEGLGTWQGRVAFALAMVAVGAVAAGAMAADRATELGSDAAGYDVVPDRTITVELRDDRFVPETIPVTAGELVEVVVVNEDEAFHTFTYTRDSVTYNHEVLGGETVRFLTSFDTAGEVPVWCEPHQPEMAGHFVVEEGS